MADAALAPAQVAAINTSFDDEDGGFEPAALMRHFWSVLYRNWRLLLAVIVACVLVSIVITMLQTRLYSSTASLKIDQESMRILGTEDANPALSRQDMDRMLQTQVDIIKSRAMAADVVKLLSLDRKDSFFGHMGINLDGKNGAMTLADRRESAEKALLNNIGVDLPKNSQIVSVSFTSADAQLSRTVANAYATAFIASNLKRKFNQTAYARDYLQDQLIHAKQRLEDSERAMIDYARQAELIDTSSGVGTNGDQPGAPSGGSRSLVMSDLMSLNGQYSAAQAARVIAEERWHQAQATPLFSLPEVVSNMAINQLFQSRAQVQATYDQERQRHRPDHPAVQQAGTQLVSIDREITQIAASIRQSINDRYRTAVRQETALKSEVDSLKQLTLAEQDRSVRYNILKRETDTNRSMYDGLLQRYKELSAEAGTSANNVSLVDAATVSSGPVSPRPFVNIALGLLLGFTVAAAAIFVREQYDDVVRSPEEVGNKLGLLLLNTIPILSGKETLTEALSRPRSPITEAYAALRIAIELSDSRGMPRSLLFTSGRPSEGKSTSSYAVARDFARSGKRTILLDGDLRRPSLHKLFGVSNKIGVSSVLSQQSSLESVIQQTDMENLAFIPAGKHPPNPTDLLSGNALRIMLDALGKQYDLVIIDAAPIIGLADSVILADRVEGVIFIVEANNAHHGHTKSAIRRLLTTGSPIMGAVLTKYNAKKFGYQYYDYY